MSFWTPRKRPMLLSTYKDGPIITETSLAATLPFLTPPGGEVNRLVDGKVIWTALIKHPNLTIHPHIREGAYYVAINKGRRKGRS
jgi:hypothetical protein